MSNYKESKNKLDEIRRKYCCKGDIILRTAIQSVVEIGQNTILSDNWYVSEITNINKRHDLAEKEGKWLFMTRDFEIAILECAKELAEINSYDLLTYIQKEVWLNGEVGEPDYHRAIQIIKWILSYEEDCYAGGERFIYKLDEYGLTDDEICYFGYEKYVYGEYNEEE